MFGRLIRITLYDQLPEQQHVVMLATDIVLLLLLLLKALQHQGSLGLLNKCFPFRPIFDAAFQICQLHPDKVALNIILPPVF